jgi:hypothetical protein
MGIVDELSRLRQLRESGALTDLEFEHAKAIALQEAARLPEISKAPVAQVQVAKEDTRLRILELENELLRLDQLWSSERENYLYRGKHGTFEPTKEYAAAVGCALGVLGLILMLTGTTDQSGAMALFGFAIMAFGIVAWVLISLKTTEFETAQNAHYNRRSEINKRIGELKQGQRTRP